MPMQKKKEKGWGGWRFRG